MAGELVLELGDMLLESDDLRPEPVAFGGELDDAFSELGGRVAALQRIASFAFDRAVDAHALGVGGPLAWPTGTGLITHADHFRTCVYLSAVSHTCTTGSCTPPDPPVRPVSWSSVWSGVRSRASNGRPSKDLDRACAGGCRGPVHLRVIICACLHRLVGADRESGEYSVPLMFAIVGVGVLLAAALLRVDRIPRLVADSEP